MLRLTLLLLFFVFTAQSQADIKFYGEASVGAGGVRHSDLDFYPRFGSFSAGFFVFENIGIEGFIDTPMGAGSRDVFDLEVTQAAGAAVRFQSPDQRGLQAFILLGYVDFQLEQQENGVVGLRTVKQSFDGVRASVGVQQHLQQFKGLIFGVEYRNYYANSGITVDGLSIGLRYEMP